MSRLEELIKQLCPNGVEYKALREIADVSIGEFVRKDKQSPDAPYPVFNGGTSNTGFYDEYNRTANKIIISARGANAGFVNRVFTDFWSGNSCYTIDVTDPSISWNYLYYWLKSREKKLLGEQQKGGIPAVSKKQVEEFLTLTPPLEVQREIVRILEQFTKLTAELTAELTARKKQYAYYRDELFRTAENATVCYLNEISENCDNQRKPVTSGNRIAGEYPYYGASGIVDYVDDYIFDGDYLLISEDGANLLARSMPIAFSISGKNWVNNHAHVLHFDTYETRRYVEIYLNSIDLSPYITGGAQPKLNQKNLNKIPIPLPSPDEQRRIVSILDRFDTLCNDLTSGLPAEIEARRKQYEYYRDKLLTFRDISEG